MSLCQQGEISRTGRDSSRSAAGSGASGSYLPPSAGRDSSQSKVRGDAPPSAGRDSSQLMVRGRGNRDRYGGGEGLAQEESRVRQGSGGLQAEADGAGEIWELEEGIGGEHLASVRSDSSGGIGQIRSNRQSAHVLQRAHAASVAMALEILCQYQVTPN